MYTAYSRMACDHVIEPISEVSCIVKGEGQKSPQTKQEQAGPTMKRKRSKIVHVAKSEEYISPSTCDLSKLSKLQRVMCVDDVSCEDSSAKRPRFVGNAQKQPGRLVCVDPATGKPTATRPTVDEMRDSCERGSWIVDNVALLGKEVLEHLRTMPTLSTFQWMRGVSAQMIIKVHSFGDPHKFALDWDNRTKGMFGAICFHGAISSFTYAKTQIFFLSRIHDGKPGYLCIVDDARSVKDAFEFGFDMRANRIVRIVCERLLMWRADDLGDSGEHVKIPTIPQSNYVRISNREEYFRIIWSCADGAIVKPALEAQMNKMKVPVDVKVAFNALCVDLFPDKLDSGGVGVLASIAGALCA